MKSRQHTDSIRAALTVLALSTLLVATPLQAAPDADAEPSMPTLGRANPYRPLILPGSAVAPPPEVAPAALPALPQAAPPKPQAILDVLEFVGVAYDGGEAIAAVRVEGRTLLMRKGERLDNAVIQSISPHKLIWRKQNRTIVKHIKRSP